jgi:proline dehydrogenase
MQNQGIHFDDTAVAFASKTNQELKKSHFVFSMMHYPLIVRIGVRFIAWALRVKLPVKGLVKKTMFRQFCGGESITDCREKVKHLGEYKVRTILDYSVEGESNEESFDKTCNEIVKVCKEAKGDENIPFSVVKPTGIGSIRIMTKAQNGEELSEEENSRLEAFKNRVEKITKAAIESEIMFMVDAEEVCMQDVVDQVTCDLMSKYNRDNPIVYNTYQLYRKDALGNMIRDAERARAEGYQFGAKLVRGAYMEKERDRATEKGYEDPIQPNKEATDRDYDAALEYCIKNIDNVGLCAGTHNEKSSAYLAQLLEDHKVAKDNPRVFFSQLLGMSDHISFNLANEGYNVAKYVPYGPVEKVMPYLFRRAEENTAMSGQTSREFSLVKKEIKRRRQSGN